MSTPARVRSIRREKANEEEGEKVESRIDDNHAVTIRSQMDANMDTSVQNTIPGDNQADVRFAVQLETIHHRVHDLWSPKQRTSEYDEAPMGRQKPNGKSKPLKGKSTPRSITPRPTQSQTPRTDKAHPKLKPKLDRAWQMVSYLQWQPSASPHGDMRHGIQLTMCLHRRWTAEEAPCSQAWQMVNQCSTSNRSLWSWCQEHEELHLALSLREPVRIPRQNVVWRSVVPLREICVQSPVILLSQPCTRPSRAWSRTWTWWARIVLVAISSARPSICATWQRGRHMLPRGVRSFEVTVNLAVGKEKARCWRSEVYADDRDSLKVTSRRPSCHFIFCFSLRQLRVRMNAKQGSLNSTLVFTRTVSTHSPLVKWVRFHALREVPSIWPGGCTRLNFLECGKFLGGRSFISE